jgi:hypothetical protein
MRYMMGGDPPNPPPRAPVPTLRSGPFVLALVIATLATACADAPAGLPPPAAPRHVTWQQFCEQAWNVPQASTLVAARGAEGWELVAMYNGALCYKRPVAEGSPARPASSSGVPSSAAPSSAALPIPRDPGF